MAANRQVRWMRGALTAMALALAGCGETPVTGPELNNGGAAAPALVRTDGGLGGFVPAHDLGADALAAGTTTKAPLTARAQIDGAVGGTVQCGRFLVTVYPGAYTGIGTVSMNMPDSTVAVVDLSISPVALNSFKVAVDLSYDPSGLGLTSPVTIYWYDGKKWVDLVAKVDSGTGLPTVHLKHFSPYGAGKAGW